MRNKYDFILIEPIYWCHAHYTSDLKNLAEILVNAGQKVAVINYLENNTYHRNRNYDVINIYPNKIFPSRDFAESENNVIIRFFKKVILDYCRYRFFKEIYQDISHLSNNFYWGTYRTGGFPIFNITMDDKRIFYWGIRSLRFTNPTLEITNNPYTLLKLILMRRKIIKNKNINFFVSNKFIKEEFKKGGLESKRLILRPERTIDSLRKFRYNKLNKNFTVLTIGFIRKDKNIEFSISTLKDTQVKFIIAGKSTTQYGKNMDKKLDKMNIPNIYRIKGFIPKEEYDNLFKKSHFILIADKKQQSVASNGTFLEAILKGRPVIAPDHKPYNYYINKYNIGLKFKSDDKISLIRTLKKAKELGTKYFKTDISSLQKEYLIDNVSSNIKRSLKNKGYFG